jgi:hypothetical protein
VRSWLLAAVLLLAAAPARAVEVGLTGSATEVVVVPGPSHGGFYPALGVTLAFPTPAVTFLASLSLEWCFECARGGFLLVGTADFPVAEHLGLDVNLTLLHDQPGLRFDQSVFFVGLGPGLSVLLGPVTLSAFVSAMLGGSPLGWSVVPGVAFTYTL